ncbi:MAG: RadC family protein [Clostridia bacterium]|nr:RadC family protein [Clostridia bacterium]
MAENEHSGHRERLRAKLDTGALCDHEYLELLLFYAIPRQNTNGLAHRLLAEFGSVPKVLQASSERLQRVQGVGSSVASFLSTIGKIVDWTAGSATSQARYPETFDYEQFLAYIKHEYKNRTYEGLDLYLLDRNNGIFLRKQFSSNSLGRVAVAPEEIMKTIISEEASGVVLVHNHPTGTCKPSLADDKTTRKLQIQCSMTNVILCDHFIYAPDGIYSYYQSGALQEMSAQTLEQIW